MSETVPEGWGEIRIRESFDLNTRSIIPSNFPDEKFTYFSLPAFDEFGSSIEVFGHEIESNKFEIICDTILVSKLNPRKPRVMLAQPKLTRACSSTEFMSFVPKNSSFVSLEYFTQYFSSIVFQRRLEVVATGSTNSHVRVSPTETSGWNITVPPLPEQKKIASILTSVDEVIENTQRQIDKLQELKKATMNELLTKGIGHTEFKDSELGRIPKSWEVKPIGEICQVGTGNKDTQDKERYGKYPFFVRSQKVEKINSYSYDGEAILTAGDGVGTGKIYHYIEGKFDYHQRVYKLSDFLDSINGKYLFYFFSNNFLKQVQGLSAKGSVESVRMEMITGMKMPIPSLPEQKKIASILTSVDELIESTQRQIDINQSLKKSLMQDLLTGKVRVQV